MNREEQNLILKEYPYMADILKQSIIVTEETARYYKTFPIVKGKRIQLAIDLISDDFIFEKYTKKLIEGKGTSRSLIIFEMYNGDTLVLNSFTKIVLYKVLSYLINDGLYFPSSKEQERIESLKKSVSLPNFIKETPPYTLSVDNVSYTVMPQTIIEFISLSPLKRKSLTTFTNIPIKHMAYLSSRFIKDNHVLDNYEISDTFKANYLNLETYQEIDYESTNQYLKIDDPTESKIVINPELKNKILSEIPNNLNDFQKLVYIYMKMCEILTYDDEFYAVNQQGVVAFRHEQIERVKEITPSNNKVVCYEFNAIFSTFIKEYGFNYELVSNGYIDSFGGGHAYLVFRFEDYIIKVDAVTGILNGDIPRVKQQLPLEGITILNRNKETITKFNAEIRNVEELYYQIGKEPTFEEYLHAYENSTPNMMQVPFTEKLDIFFNKIQNNNYAPVDRLSYIQSLKKVLFSSLELTNNISISFIRNNHPLPDVEAESLVVIVVDDDMFDSSKYYTYNERLGLLDIEKEELQERFNNGHYEYISSKQKKLIPGIEEVTKNVRRVNQIK